jgi:hypothetical protein
LGGAGAQFAGSVIILVMSSKKSNPRLDVSPTARTSFMLTRNRIRSSGRTWTCSVTSRQRKESDRDIGKNLILGSGGKYIAGGFNKAIGLSGSPPPNRVVLLQFADRYSGFIHELRDGLASI